ncbi:Flagellar protein FliS [compost metagenome]
MQTQVETASPGRLLLMLYEGALRFCNGAIKAIEEKNHPQAHQNLIKVSNIVTELMATLNMEEGGEIAQNLFDVYEYVNRRLTDANIRKDAAIVQEVHGLLQDLHTAWVQAIKNVGALQKTSA